MTDLPEPVAALIAAANANDTEAFLRSLHPDAVVDDWGREFAGTTPSAVGAATSSSASPSRST